MTRYEFLAALHVLLKPATYLEIGVQHGLSLRLANCQAIGVDPSPQVGSPLGPNAYIVQETSDVFWTRTDAQALAGQLDLAFIDGMHLVEFVVRDFRGVEALAHPGTVVVMDDVLPRNHAEAARRQCPGDWTGDVWKIHEILSIRRPDLTVTLVDTQPTGLLVVTGLDPASRVLHDGYDEIVGRWVTDDPQTVPPWVLSRRDADDPGAVLAMLAHRP